MNTNDKIHKAFNTHTPPGWELNEYQPNNGVNKAVAKEYWNFRGSFDGKLYDRILEIKHVKK